MQGRVLVICAGNVLVADDGAGWAVYERLSRARLPENVTVEKTGCVGLGLLDFLDGQRLLVVVDAVRFGAPPGTLHVLEWESLPGASHSAVSAHGVHMRDAVEVARRLDPERAPGRAILVGIEGSCFDQLGGGLTPLVAAAVESAAQAVLRLVETPAERDVA
jgi:hydrogenase maturation protease